MVTMKKKAPDRNTSISNKRQKKSKPSSSASPSSSTTVHETLTLAAVGIHTSEELIRTLKKADADSDKEKIDIARTAWLDCVTPIPRKADLLLDWILSVLSKDVKLFERRNVNKTVGDNDIQASHFGDKRFWHLANDILSTLNDVETQRLLSHQSFFPLLFALGGEILRSKDIHGFEQVLPASLAVLSSLFRSRSSSHTISIDMVLSSMADWLHIISWAFGHQTLQRQNPVKHIAPLVQMLTQIWVELLHKPSNVSRSASAFEEFLFVPFAQALKWVNDSDDSTKSPQTAEYFTLLRSSLMRISHECLILVKPLGEFGSYVAEKAKSLPDEESRLHILPIFLAQQCADALQRHAKPRSTFQEEANIRQSMFFMTFCPFVSLLIQSKSNLNLRLRSLKSLLDIAEDKSLYVSSVKHHVKEENTAETYITQIVLFLMTIVEEPRTKYDTTIYDLVLRNFSVLHKGDPDIITSSQWVKILSTIAHYPATPTTYDLLQARCASSARARTMDSFIEQLYEAIGERCKEHDAGTSETLELLSVKVVQSNILQKRFWEKELGVALNNFTSSEQSLDMLRSASAKVISSYQALPDDERAGQQRKQRTNQLFSTAIASFYLTMLVIQYIPIPAPIQADAMHLIETFYQEVVEPAILQGLNKPSNSNTASLGASAFALTQSLVSKLYHEDCPGKDQVFSRIFSTQNRNFQTISHFLKSSNGPPELRIMTYLGVLQRIKLDKLLGLTSSHLDFLGDPAVLHDLTIPNDNIADSEDDALCEWLHGLQSLHSPLIAAVTANYLDVMKYVNADITGILLIFVVPALMLLLRCSPGCPRGSWT